MVVAPCGNGVPMKIVYPYTWVEGAANTVAYSHQSRTATDESGVERTVKVHVLSIPLAHLRLVPYFAPGNGQTLAAMVAAYNQLDQGTVVAAINGGYFVFEPRFFDYLGDDESVLEREPLMRVAGAGELGAYQHHGFWQPMDTLREKRILDDLWARGDAPWRIW